MPDRRVGNRRLNEAVYGASLYNRCTVCDVAECPPEGGGPFSAIAGAIACQASGHCPALRLIPGKGPGCLEV